VRYNENHLPILLLILILFLNGITSSIKANGLIRKKGHDSSVEVKNNSTDSAQFYYDEGLALHDIGEYLEINS
jgi:competence protein ComGC